MGPSGTHVNQNVKMGSLLGGGCISKVVACGTTVVARKLPPSGGVGWWPAGAGQGSPLQATLIQCGGLWKITKNVMKGGS